MESIIYNISNAYFPVTVYLKLGAVPGSTVIATNTHNFAGQYSFDNVLEGQYTIHVVDIYGCSKMINTPPIDGDCELNGFIECDLTTTTLEVTTTSEITTTSLPTTTELPTTTIEPTTTETPTTTLAATTTILPTTTIEPTTTVYTEDIYDYCVGSPLYEGVGGLASDSSSDSVNIPYPAIINEDDFLILIIAEKSSVTFVTPIGWNVFSANESDANLSVKLYYKFADGTESGSLTVSSDGIGNIAGVIYRYSSVTTAPFIGGTYFITPSVKNSQISSAGMLLCDLGVHLAIVTGVVYPYINVGYSNPLTVIDSSLIDETNLWTFINIESHAYDQNNGINVLWDEGHFVNYQNGLRIYLKGGTEITTTTI